MSYKIDRAANAPARYESNFRRLQVHLDDIWSRLGLISGSIPSTYGPGFRFWTTFREFRGDRAIAFYPDDWSTPGTPIDVPPIIGSPRYRVPVTALRLPVTENSIIDDLVVFVPDGQVVTLSGTASSYQINLPQTHFILAQSNGDLSGLSASVVVAVNGTAITHTVTPGTPDTTADFAASGFNVVPVAEWKPNVNRMSQGVKVSRFATHGFPVTNGDYLYRIYSVVIGDGYCQIESPGEMF